MRAVICWPTPFRICWVVKMRAAEPLVEQDSADTASMVEDPLAEAEDTGGEHGEYDEE